ncbi:hypothetical protein D3C72_2391100 [compost metagenome]
MGEGTARTTGDLAAVALTGRVRIAGQLLQTQTGRIALFVALLGVVGGCLQLGVFLGELGGEFFALEFTLE